MTEPEPPQAVQRAPRSAPRFRRAAERRSRPDPPNRPDRRPIPGNDLNEIGPEYPIVLSERALPIVFAMIRTEHVRKFAHCRKCGAQTRAAPPLRTSRPVHHGRIIWIIHKFSSASFQDRA